MDAGIIHLLYWVQRLWALDYISHTSVRLSHHQVSRNSVLFPVHVHQHFPLSLLVQVLLSVSLYFHLEEVLIHHFEFVLLLYGGPGFVLPVHAQRVSEIFKACLLSERVDTWIFVPVEGILQLSHKVLDDRLVVHWLHFFAFTSPQSSQSYWKIWVGRISLFIFCLILDKEL
jgi:hypothetical protein